MQAKKCRQNNQQQSLNNEGGEKSTIPYKTVLAFIIQAMGYYYYPGKGGGGVGGAGMSLGGPV